MLGLIKLIPSGFRDRHRAKWHRLQLETQALWGKLTRQFVRPALPQISATNLHLGCGAVNHPEFINIDGLGYKHIHYVRAIDNLAPFGDRTVALIYASHCLEHFSHVRVNQVLQEWHRAIEPGGILRLSVPDFELLLDIYRDNDNNLAAIQQPLMGGQDYKYNFHHVAFNRRNLTAMLKQAGFQTVRGWQPGTSSLTTFDDWSTKKMEYNGKQYSISLNLEAIK